MYKDKISKYLMVGVLSLFLLLSTVSLTSCQLLSPVSDTVATTTDNIKPGSEQYVVKPGKDITKAIPKDVQDKLSKDGKEIVLAHPEDVIDESKSVKLANPNGDNWSGLVNLGLGIANTLLPGTGALGALQFIFSPRARSHYMAAVDALNPMSGGSVDVKEAVVSVGRAMGFAHSSPESKKSFEGVGSEPLKTS